MRRFLQVFYILFSSLLFTLALPNELYKFGSPFYGFLVLIPFYFVYTDFKSYKEAGLCTGLFAALVHLFSSYWLAYFKDFAAFTLGASAFGTGVIGFCVGLFLYVPFSKAPELIQFRMKTSPLYGKFISFRIFWFCAVYVVYEWIKSNGFLAYPWGTISSTMYRAKYFIQIADITGTYGISFLVILFSAILTEGFLIYTNARKNKAYVHAAQSWTLSAFVWASLSVFALIYGTVRYNSFTQPDKYLNAVIVQQNADPWKEKDDNKTISRSQTLTETILDEAKIKGEKVNVVVWSEGCLKYSFPSSYSHYTRFPVENPLIPFIKDYHLPFILGGSYMISREPRRVMNAALLFDKNGEFRGAYGKNHLVPLAEVIPFSEYPKVKDFLKKKIGISAGWTPGDQYVYFDIQCEPNEDAKKPDVKVISLAHSLAHDERTQNAKPYVRIATPICFDDAFPDVCRPLVMNGSEVFVNITDDSWSKTKSSEYQHFVISAFRTIEYRISMVRSTNSGYSVVLDQKGNILKDLPLFEESSTLCKVPVFKPRYTTYLIFGNWIPQLSAVAILLVTLYYILTKYQNVEVNSERKKFKKKKKHHHKK